MNSNDEASIRQLEAYMKSSLNKSDDQNVQGLLDRFLERKKHTRHRTSSVESFDDIQLEFQKIFGGMKMMVSKHLIFIFSLQKIINRNKFIVYLKCLLYNRYDLVKLINK